MAPISFSTDQYQPASTFRTEKFYPLEKRHETPKDEGPTPLGWIAVAVVVPIIIIAVGLWTCSRYRRGWRVGEISGKRRRLPGSNRSNKGSNNRQLNRNHRWGREQGQHHWQHQDQRTLSGVTAWPGANYGLSTSPDHVWGDDRNDSYGGSYVSHWRQYLPTELENELNHKRRLICRRCLRRAAWDYEQRDAPVVIRTCLRCYKRQNRNACIIEGPRTGEFYWVAPGRGVGDADTGLDYDYSYDYGYDQSTTSRVDGMGNGPGGRGEDDNWTDLQFPRQMRSAHLPVRNERSGDSLGSFDGNYGSGRRSSSESSSSWTSRFGDGSSVPFAAWRARW